MVEGQPQRTRRDGLLAQRRQRHLGRAQAVAGQLRPQRLQDTVEPRRPAADHQRRAVAEWAAADEANAEGSVTRTIENISLANGATITLGRAMNGGRNARFERLEIAPAAGGAAMIFRREMMSNAGPRESMLRVVFPGADGSYTLKVTFVNDPEGKAKFAVSVREPRPTAPESAPARSASPMIPEPKIK